MRRSRQLLFIQGGGAGAHDQWDQKLVDSLQQSLGREYEVRYPRMPAENDPSYDRWKPALERELAALEQGAILVGHSIGGTILVRLLTERPAGNEPAAIVLLGAPFVGRGGWPSDEFETPRDAGKKFPHGTAVHIFHGSADATAPPAHGRLYAEVIPQAQLHELVGRDHQLNNDLSPVATAIREGRSETHQRGER